MARGGVDRVGAPPELEAEGLAWGGLRAGGGCGLDRCDLGPVRREAEGRIGREVRALGAEAELEGVVRGEELRSDAACGWGVARRGGPFGPCVVRGVDPAAGPVCVGQGVGALVHVVRLPVRDLVDDVVGGRGVGGVLVGRARAAGDLPLVGGVGCCGGELDAHGPAGLVEDGSLGAERCGLPDEDVDSELRGLEGRVLAGDDGVGCELADPCVEGFDAGEVDEGVGGELADLGRGELARDDGVCGELAELGGGGLPGDHRVGCELRRVDVVGRGVASAVDRDLLVCGRGACR